MRARSAGATDSVALVLTMAALLSMSIGMVFMPRDLNSVYTPEHVSYFAMYDAIRQRAGYSALLCFLAIIAVAVWVNARYGVEERVPSLLRFTQAIRRHLSAFGSLYVLAFVVLYLVFKPPDYPLWYRVHHQTIGALDGGAMSRLQSAIVWEAAAHPFIFIGALVAAFTVSACTIRLLERVSPIDPRLVVGFCMVALALIVNPEISTLIVAETAACIGLYVAARAASGRVMHGVLWACLVGYVVFLLLPGLTVPLAPTLPTEDALDGVPLVY